MRFLSAMFAFALAVPATANNDSIIAGQCPTGCAIVPNEVADKIEALRATVKQLMREQETIKAMKCT